MDKGYLKTFDTCYRCKATDEDVWVYEHDCRRCSRLSDGALESLLGQDQEDKSAFKEKTSRHKTDRHLYDAYYQAGLNPFLELSPSAGPDPRCEECLSEPPICYQCHQKVYNKYK